jgi:hypothetical protein
MKIPPSSTLGLLVLGILALAPSAKSAVAVEYFNDYGSATVGLVAGNLNGGSGWSGAWQGGASNSYFQAANPTYSGTGYADTGNDSGSDDGVARGSSTSSVAYRTLANGGMGGTIWLSAIVQQTASGDMLLWLDKTSTATTGVEREFVSLRGSTGTSGDNTPEAVMSYNGSGDMTSSAVNFAAGTHLFLVRVDMNYSATLDAISFWINPVLTGGEAGLGAPIYTANTLDAYGTLFDGIGFSSDGTQSTLDAIRISNESDGFQFVTTGVPEPSMAVLMLAGAAGFIARRRR